MSILNTIKQAFAEATHSNAMVSWNKWAKRFVLK